MLKIHCFDMNIHPETFVPLVHCVIDDICLKPCQTFVSSRGANAPAYWAPASLIRPTPKKTPVA